mmetsp:Transcript_129934/g.277457  ORF Transcript_129934/g.277457 Transcript_129934/m.277457 type:complete len:242 (+) Transcript_129934:129-854(+)
MGVPPPSKLQEGVLDQELEDAHDDRCDDHHENQARLLICQPVSANDCETHPEGGNDPHDEDYHDLHHEDDETPTDNLPRPFAVIRIELPIDACVRLPAIMACFIPEDRFRDFQECPANPNAQSGVNHDVDPIPSALVRGHLLYAAEDHCAQYVQEMDHTGAGDLLRRIKREDLEQPPWLLTPPLHQQCGRDGEKEDRLDEDAEPVAQDLATPFISTRLEGFIENGDHDRDPRALGVRDHST